MIEKVKWFCIIAKSIVTDSTVVDFFGSTYVVAGNVVKRIR